MPARWRIRQCQCDVVLSGKERKLLTGILPVSEFKQVMYWNHFK
jgi:hypothetical protein